MDIIILLYSFPEVCAGRIRDGSNWLLLLNYFIYPTNTDCLQGLDTLMVLEAALNYHGLGSLQQQKFTLAQF